LSLLQHPNRHTEHQCIFCRTAEPPRAILKRSVRPFKRSTGVEKPAVLEFAVNEDVLLDNKVGSYDRVAIVNRDWHVTSPLGQQFRDCPDVIRDSALHCRGASNRAVHPAEIVESKV
jgi:hypothetical protein